MKARHPEKVNNPIHPIKKKPKWLRTRIFDTKNYFKFAFEPTTKTNQGRRSQI